MEKKAKVPATRDVAELVVPREIDELRSLSTPQLREELGKSLEMTATHLRRLAAIVKLLEERGEDLTDLRIGFLTYLRLIAHGQVLPEVVVRYGEMPSLVRRIGALPMPDQERLARGEPVAVAVRREDGSYDRRLVDPLVMSQAQIWQVFGPGRLRDEAEQIQILDSRAPHVYRRSSRVKIGRITVDRRRGGIKVGSIFLTKAEVVKALAELAGAEEGEDEDEGVSTWIPATTNLRPAQHDALRTAAYKGRTKLSTLIRRALGAYGLLTPDQD